MRVFAGLFLFVISLAPGSAHASVPSSVHWVDGESGRFNGRPFRLYQVDAPEIGAVGAMLRGAKCEAETELGFEATAFMTEFTRGKAVELTGSYGVDPLGRQLLDLAVDGQDLKQAGMKAGYLQYWAEQGNPEGIGKPDWCS